MIQSLSSVAPTLLLLTHAGKDDAWHVRLISPIVLDATLLSLKLTVFDVPKQLEVVQATVFLMATGATFLNEPGTVNAAAAFALTLTLLKAEPKIFAKVPGAVVLATTRMQFVPLHVAAGVV